MGLPKKKNHGTLGRAMIKNRFQGQKAFAVDEGKLHTTDIEGEGDSWMKMRSITQENDLEAFLSTAELAGTDFTAERLNVKVVQDSYANPFLLSDKEEQERIEKQEANLEKLSVPRRPHWEKTMTAEQVQRNERESFLNWRRGMAQLEEEEGLLLTPYEKNLEVWRQLWRVIERSRLVVQIVDARNPLLFRSADLDKYVKEVDPRKGNLLLINKADFLTKQQRTQWADYFDSKGIRYTFFSAKAATTAQEEAKAAALQQQELEELANKSSSDDDDSSDEEESPDTTTDRLADNLDTTHIDNEEDNPHDVEADTKDDSDSNDDDDNSDEDNQDPRIRIRTTANLLDLLVSETPTIEDDEEANEKITIGLVGYPNVGKSSTINALIGEKCVSVSSTPGKTKHFQTIHLSPTLILCDCPGLVFPTFSTTKADQVCNGVLPIDQLREHTGPTSLVARRIPQRVLEATYGIRIRTMPIEDGGSGIPTSAEFCSTYAIARGYFRSSQGTPDESRAARYILKDYVNGKLLFCHPPPGIEEDEFNKDIHEAALKTDKKLAPTTRVPAHALNYVAPADGTTTQIGSKTESVDNAFFKRHLNAPSIRGKYAGSMRGGFSRVNLYPHQQRTANDGSAVPQGRRERLAMVQQNMADVGAGAMGKKHKKGKKHVKVRSGAGFDYV
ncbi:hypothetical protein [Absidia glauca]|uniref:CP-type G domain-containing protein n=1 Tax=Absidia glauca TaxID=4829 RepID=A0A163JZV4_ABSGL|nr:hypothetical protein [Absidia glauca]